MSEYSPRVEAIAQKFHETYERLAPDHGYETREASSVPWAQVPQQNRQLMIAVVAELLERHVIRAGSNWLRDPA